MRCIGKIEHLGTKLQINFFPESKSAKEAEVQICLTRPDELIPVGIAETHLGWLAKSGGIHPGLARSPSSQLFDTFLHLVRCLRAGGGIE